MQISKSTKYGFVGVVVVAVIAFLVSGVLASTSITVNAGNRVTLGAGAAFATSCDETVTATPLTTFNTTNGTYQLTTISVKDIGDAFPSGVTTCIGRTLNLAFLNNSTAYYASWPILADGASNEYHFGNRSGGNNGSGIYYATSTFTAQSATTLTSIAISIN
jgi:hypothetical protein